MTRAVLSLAALVLASCAFAARIEPAASAIPQGGLSAGAIASSPPCAETNANVPVPAAPHGLYAWNPYMVKGGAYEHALETSVIGKDPTLCGVSLVVQWSAVEPQKNRFDWSIVMQQARPYVAAHLRVNLLFADASEVGGEGHDAATPGWVFTQDGVAKIQCSNQPFYPNYLDPAFEADWAAFIAQAVKKFSGTGSTLAPSVGYMRFATGAGVEAYPAHFEPTAAASKPCYDQWVGQAHWTFDKWQFHSVNVIKTLAQQTTDKQLMVALNYIPYGPPSVYAYANALARNAAPLHIAFGTENLGINHVADPGTTPHACNTQVQRQDLYWCQAFTRHAGQVPLEFQPIAATTPGSTQGYTLDLGNLLQYAIDNHAQIIELYPQQWTQATTADHAALKAAAAILN